ncbi:MAG: proline dehydrogenase family protein, partial [Pseudomonadales bacterium]
MPASELAELRSIIRNTTHADEIASVEALMERAEQALTPAQRSRILARSRSLVARCRESSSHPGALDAFLQEFGLTNPEGVALMCLAEALLRIPDETTADKLIAEKIGAGDWQAHLGKSRSHVVNASVWGLMLTGRLVTLDSDLATDIDGWMHRLVNRLGEPVVRTAVIQAMRILARQFVLGRTIDEALQTDDGRSEPRSLYSFDMLGEGARTWSDAEQFYTSYSNAIDTVGLGESATDPKMANGISLKLSALHPRYEQAQRDAVLNDLGVKLLTLAVKARSYGLGFSIDAEEASRLDLSLSLFEALARSPELSNWNGLGFVLQAYQKRAPAIADWLISLGLETGRQIMVRLVKGAYWDAEIKHAQEQGFADYPVFTRKTNTDLSFEVCATRLLQAPRAIYPQFATHNATTVCQVIELAGNREY